MGVTGIGERQKQIMILERDDYTILKKDPPKNIILYFSMPQERENLEHLYDRVKKLSRTGEDASGNDLATGKNFALVTVWVRDWNKDLSPWTFREDCTKTPKPGMDFAGEGALFLERFEGELLPMILRDCEVNEQEVNLYLAGYSLAGLFCLWTLYQSDRYVGAASCSGSLWFPGFCDYAEENSLCRKSRLYLSLGRKEDRTANPYMAKAGECVERLTEHYRRKEKVDRVLFEWNPGNHFHEPGERLAKGMAYLLCP